MEAILGVRRQGDVLVVAPCIPREWPRFEVVFRHLSARYEIAVENPTGVCGGIAHVELDGETLPPGPARIPLHDDGRRHQVRVVLGEAPPARLVPRPE
jgi:cyclic beta-1,2-glucan synthetase